MPCAFHYERPAPFERLGPGCQFNESEEALIEYEEKKWCCFHLPATAERSDADTEKAHAQITKKIYDKLYNNRPSDFSGVVFTELLNLEGKGDILGDICFSKSTFLNGIICKNSNFKGFVCFEDSEFFELSDIQSCNFFRGVTFKRSFFNSFVFFDKSSFINHKLGKCIFNKTVFIGGTSFKSTDFLGVVSFFEATFKGFAYFNGSKFRDNVNFEGTNFSYVDFEGSSFSSTIDFSNSSITDKLCLNKAEFFGSANFSSTIFSRAPEFHDVVFRQETDFSGAAFLDVGQSGHNDAVRASMAYRTLKLAMENLRARDEEAQFFRLEQRSKRNRDDVPKSVKAASYIYELTADYGQSLWRPWACFAALFVLFAALNVLRFQFESDTGMLGWSGLAETAQQTFRPFHGFDPRLAATDKPPMAFRLLGALHSLANFGLLALFLVALRRRFKMI